jgi:hypothetical protein
VTGGSLSTGNDPAEDFPRLRSLRAMVVLNSRHWHDFIAALRLAKIETCISINSKFDKMPAPTRRHLFESCCTTIFGDAK